MTSINNIQRFRQRIAAGELCVGTGITFCDPSISELMGEVGYDFTWIDMEHGPIDLQIALGHVMALRGTHTAPFVRVRVNDVAVIKRVLDLAPAGIIVPNVKTADGAGGGSGMPVPAPGCSRLRPTARPVLWENLAGPVSRRGQGRSADHSSDRTHRSGQQSRCDPRRTGHRQHLPGTQRPVRLDGQAWPDQ